MNRRNTLIHQGAERLASNIGHICQRMPCCCRRAEPRLRRLTHRECLPAKTPLQPYGWCTPMLCTAHRSDHLDDVAFGVLDNGSPHSVLGTVLTGSKDASAVVRHRSDRGVHIRRLED
jgi:hypothetical protein